MTTQGFIHNISAPAANLESQINLTLMTVVGNPLRLVRTKAPGRLQATVFLL